MIAGKDKGKSGSVAKAMPKENRIVVTGINIMKKHVKARKSGEKGQILEIPGPIHVSNVRLDGAPKEKKAKSTKAKKTTK